MSKDLTSSYDMLAPSVREVLVSKDKSNYPHIIPQHELELLSTIGEGGFCDVWEGRWFGAPVAIKRLMLPEDETERSRIASDFLHEIQLHSSLNFPSIIPVMGMCIQDPKLMYMVMEQAPLGSLFSLLHIHNHRSAPIEMPMSLRVCLVGDCASAISFVHSRNIVHRDIKSMNYLVFPGWRIKLCDFGLSLPVNMCEEPFPKRNGTYAWLAPECISECRYSLSSDVYALSMVAYELLNRKPPFDGMSDEAIAETLEANIRPVFDLDGKDEEVPPTLRDLVEIGWSTSHEVRPSAKEVENSFRKCVDEKYGGDPRNDQLLSLLNINFMDSTNFDATGSGGGEHGTATSSSTSPSHQFGSKDESANDGVRWDAGLDVAQLRLAFLEMAESGVIFERAKELSLHLSRTQNKPFIHDSEANQSIFLDEDGVSKEIIMEANAIMHKLIRHYARKQRKALVIADSRASSQTSNNGASSSSSNPTVSPTRKISAHGGRQNGAASEQDHSSPTSSSSSSKNGEDGLMSPIPAATLSAKTPHHKPSKLKSVRGRGTPRKGSGPRMV